MLYQLQLHSFLLLLQEANDDVYFISLKDIMSPEETPDYYSEDLVHPSEEGHQAIGNHIADFITNSG